MIKITLIAMGKIKEKYLSDAINEYKKRLSKYCDFNVLELEPVRLPEKPSNSEIMAALEKEAELIIKKIPQHSEIYSLCVEGKELSSMEFSNKMQLIFNEGKSLTFIIGSSYGLAETIKKLSNFKLSVSQMTFPHQLFRVMLLEQVYRAFKIIEGSTYHK